MPGITPMACRGALGRSYCVGGYGERTNRQIVELICDSLDQAQPKGSPHSQLIQRVSDRPATTAATRSIPAAFNANLAGNLATAWRWG